MTEAVATAPAIPLQATGTARSTPEGSRTLTVSVHAPVIRRRNAALAAAAAAVPVLNPQRSLFPLPYDLDGVSGIGSPETKA
jgi:hypothetical protein